MRIRGNEWMAPGVLYRRRRWLYIHNDAIGIRAAERDSLDDIILRCAPPDIYEQRVLLVLSRSKDRLATTTRLRLSENGAL